MGLGLGRWRPQHLLLAWSAYWATLALVTLGPALRAIWNVTRPGQHGGVSAALDDSLLRLTVTSDTQTAWAGAAHVGTLALWIAGPPLLLWLAWLVSRPWRGAPALPAGAHGAAVPPGASGGTPHGAELLNPASPEPTIPTRPGREGVRDWRDRTT